MRTVGLKIGDISAETVDGFNSTKLGLGSDINSPSSIRASILVYLKTIQLIRQYQSIWRKNTPIICFEYNKPIRSTILNFNKLVTGLDIDTKTPDL